MSGHDFVDWPHETTHQKVPIPGSASEWTRWNNVKPREVPAREKRQGPRDSRFENLLENA